VPHRRQAVWQLRLGPRVGHTDDVSTRVWIQAADDPRRYALRVQRVGLFPFVGTEEAIPEFGTAVATAEGLRPDTRYRYRVTRLGRFVPGASGSVRTMPSPSSMAPLLFCAISCNRVDKGLGAWERFAEFVEDAEPSFVLMMGDQVYLDDDQPNIVRDHLKSRPSVRRKAIADKYRRNWSREPVRKVMANFPVYMIWDDHDSKDGWGSSAGDSQTMLRRHHRGAEIFRKSNAYFDDARDAYWHFQACCNPRPVDTNPLDPLSPKPGLPSYINGPLPHGERVGMPFVFRCGCLVVLVLDSRGDRDVFRTERPILGQRQWEFIDQVFAELPADVEALAMVTPTPIASMDPGGQTQKLVGRRTDDIEAFKRGDEEAVFEPYSTEDPEDLASAIAGAWLSRLTGRQHNVGPFKVSNIDEARDQWSHPASRPEQADLLRKAGDAMRVNRNPGAERGLIFVSGDVHVGCRFDISVRKPPYKALSLTSSGISTYQDVAYKLYVGSLIDDDFSVAPGIHSTLKEVVPDFNFGVIQVQATGNGAEITGTIAHEGNAFAAGVDIADIL
jgi:hypothetical protein